MAPYWWLPMVCPSQPTCNPSKFGSRTTHWIPLGLSPQWAHTPTKRNGRKQQWGQCLCLKEVELILLITPHTHPIYLCTNAHLNKVDYIHFLPLNVWMFPFEMYAWWWYKIHTLLVQMFCKWLPARGETFLTGQNLKEEGEIFTQATNYTWSYFRGCDQRNKRLFGHSDTFSWGRYEKRHHKNTNGQWNNLLFSNEFNDKIKTEVLCKCRRCV